MEEQFVKAAMPELQWALRGWLDETGRACQSPIEQMLLAAMTFTISLIGWSNNFKSTFGVADDKPLGDPKDWPALTFVPQFPLHNYKIDIAIFIVGGALICVECDGHEFHERTAEQAQHDRSRDRFLTEHNIPFLRFTGREIYRDVFACADQVLKIAFRKMGPGKL